YLAVLPVNPIHYREESLVIQFWKISKDLWIVARNREICRKGLREAVTGPGITPRRKTSFCKP
ncbi:hypothetical protein L9F63_020709, partial [Diploptera punctata]